MGNNSKYKAMREMLGTQIKVANLLGVKPLSIKRREKNAILKNEHFLALQKLIDMTNTTYYIIEQKSFYNSGYAYSFIPDSEENSKVRRVAEALEFETLESAQAWIDDFNGEMYHRSHNEYSRPDHKIVERDIALDFEHMWEHGDLGASAYNWDHCKDDENPTEEEEIEAIQDFEDKIFEEIK